MRKIRELIGPFEVKMASIFAISACFTVFLIGLFKQIRFAVIFKRFLIAELYFIPVGLLVGYITRTVFPVQSAISDDERTFRDADYTDNKNIDDSVVDAESINAQSGESTTDNSTYTDVSVLDAPSETPTVNVVDEQQKVKKMSKSNLGKHIIVEDKKIINDPKLMAEAIKTMINKE